MTCVVNFVMFSVSFNLIYGPLLLKTVRIYRIFYSSVSAVGGLRLRLIGSTYQLIFAFILLLIQVNAYLTDLRDNDREERNGRRREEGKREEDTWGGDSSVVRAPDS